MNRSIYFAIIGLLCSSLYWTGCSKSEDFLEPPISEQAYGPPLFELRASIDGDSVVLRAGVNSYYMFSDQYVGGDERLHFVGSLQPISCDQTPCPNSFQVEILDPQNGLNSSRDTYTESYFRSLSYGFFQSDAPSWVGLPFYITATHAINAIPSNLYWFWKLGNIEISGPYSSSFLVAGALEEELCMRILTSQGATYEQCQPIDLTQNCHYPFTMNLTQVGQNSMYMDVELVDQDQFSPLSSSYFREIVWTVVDMSGQFVQSIGQQAQASFNLPDERYQICVSVTDSLGCVSSFCRIADLHEIAPNLNYTKALHPYEVPQKEHFALKLRWTNAQGVTYYSHQGRQPANAHLYIKSVRPYLENENGQNTVILDLSVDCYLFNEKDAVRFQTDNLTVAVALPN